MSRWHKAKPLSQKIRKRIYRRDKFRCVICHSRIDLEIDHILPISRGGSADDEKNLQLLCRDHHFNSNANYAAPIGSEAAGAEFKDTWSLSDIDSEWINLIADKHQGLHRVLLAAMTDSDKSYLAYMAARLLEMRRVLKPTGSIYLHCDPTMSHYLKLVMDAIFGRKNFRAEIIWKRTSSHNLGAKQWSAIHRCAYQNV